ncbi:MAG: site-2 protease family protein [Verrucomicrobiales bacterium]|nr:site-2 protease family protein [Verrucomicrobiales bacterium]
MLQFTLFGFPIRIQWMFWVVGCLLVSGLLSSPDPRAIQLILVWLVVFFVSILWHELGHAFAMRRFGGHPEILLYGMGGVCSSVGRYTRVQSMIISAAGPAAGFLLALVACLPMLLLDYEISWKRIFSAHSFHSLTEFALLKLLFINIFWTLLNLLPILPLDGGQIFRDFMSKTNPAVVPKVGMITAGIVAVLSFTFLGSLFMALMFGYLAYQNYNMSKGQSFRMPF